MSPLRRAARRLQVTTQVLRHGPGALVGTPAGGATTGRAAPSEAEQRRERVRAGHDEARALTGRPQLLADLDVALPATARERFPRALATDLEAWRALPEEGADEGRRAGLLRELDAWTADDPALSHANGHYRARLLAPGATREDVLAAVLAGTPVVTPPSVAATLPSDVADLVTVVEDLVALRDEVQPLLLQDELFDRESLRLRRTAVRRFLTSAREDLTVSAIIPTNRPHQVDNILENIGRQRHPVELVLVLHGLEVDQADLDRRAADAGVARLRVVHAPASATLGACMNLGVDAASGAYVAKMDDDNHYGAEFIGDLVDAAVVTGAEIVGKWAHYVWLRSSGAVVLRYPDAENRGERRVQGGSMLFTADAVRSVRFSDIPRAVDSDILDRSLARGLRVFSADRFNYVSIREPDPTRHTWKVVDATFFTRTGRLLFYGDPREHVAV